MINLENLGDLWYNKIELLMGEINGIEFTDEEHQKEKAQIRSEKAEISRKLLELADLFAMCEVVVRNEYWYAKGRGVDMNVEVFDE